MGRRDETVVKVAVLSSPLQRGPKQRIADAEAFFAMAKEEIQDGRARGQMPRIREGAEKLFHSLNEACAARIQKYGIGVPESHDEVVKGLETCGERDLKDLYKRAFGDLHVWTYYRGQIDAEQLKRYVDEIGKAIGSVKRVLQR
jgi:hypothetical protein